MTISSERIKRPKPLVIMILDGWGVSDNKLGNAILAAKTPRMDAILERYPHNTIDASGLSVGLPDGQMGNSEVGHLNIGAGRIVYQDFSRINMAIADSSFFANEDLLKAMARANERSSTLHLMGLLSDGGVHSHQDHLYALLKMAKDNGVNDVLIHLFLDGRDTPPKSGAGFIFNLSEKIEQIGLGRIASLSGRYYAMDRDERFDRVKLAYEAIAYGKGVKAESPALAIKASYADGIDDEFILPTVVLSDYKGFKEDDSIIFFNFRPDRAREITKSIVDPDFSGFNRGAAFVKPYFVCMTQYEANLALPVAFPIHALKSILADVLAEHGLIQLRMAETEKYAHVTFFFNGGVEPPKRGEERILIPSPKVATYDLKPEMSAFEVASSAISKIEEGGYDVIIINFANPDMVGHTGIFEAAVKAIEAVDDCFGRVAEATIKAGGEALILADHGNAEKMIDYETGVHFTAHTTNPVPLIYVTGRKVSIATGGILADVAPTALDILMIPKPAEMTGRSLIIST